MALLDFMKQGTQWLTDNTGMDWNTVQRDPGMAAKRLMGGPVDLSSQQQYQQSQNSLLGTPEDIVVDPAMQNRMTYNSPQSDAEFFPDYRTVQSTSSLDDLHGVSNGWDRNRKEGQGVVNAIAADYANRETYQNLPQTKADYQTGLLEEDKLYGNYPMLGFTEIDPNRRADDPIPGGTTTDQLINAEDDRLFKAKQNAIAEAKQDAINHDFSPHPNMLGDEGVANFDQSDKTNEFNANDGASGNSGEQGVWDTIVNFGRGIGTAEGGAVDSIDQTLVNALPEERKDYLQLRKNTEIAIQIDALDVPDARKIELYNQKGIPVPDKYSMKGLIDPVKK